MARECFKDPTTQAHLLKHIGVVIRNELKTMCSEKTGSILRTEKATNEMKTFAWERLIAELSENAPVFLSLLNEATHSRRRKEIGMQ